MPSYIFSMRKSEEIFVNTGTLYAFYSNVRVIVILEENNVFKKSFTLLKRNRDYHIKYKYITYFFIGGILLSCSYPIYSYFNFELHPLMSFPPSFLGSGGGYRPQHFFYENKELLKQKPEIFLLISRNTLAGLIQKIRTVNGTGGKCYVYVFK